jgi:pimeloyl-ACP methyl ester carboxylesterase
MDQPPASRTRQRALFVSAVIIVAILGVIYGFYQINKANFGVPGFYVWRVLTGQSHTGARANVNGVSIYYETYGKGPPVLVLHGATGFLETMHYFIQALAPSHTVIAVDSRAQGRSTDSSPPLSYTLMANDMIKLMDTLHIKQADVVGWSDGGIIGLDMAMTHPDRVRRLVAISANYDVNGLDPQAFHAGFEAETAAQVKPFYDRIAPDPSHFPIMLRKVSAMLRSQPHYTTAELSLIRARVLIVAGEHDLILRWHTDNLAHAVPGAREVIVPGATHFGPLEQPAVYSDLVVNFLNAP